MLQKARANGLFYELDNKRNDYHMTQDMNFLLINFFFSLIASYIFFDIYKRQQFLFLKPSILVFFFMHVFFQWPLVAFDIMTVFSEKSALTCPTSTAIETFYEKNK
jgi:hypothetical protein